jgi:hypothetical protein
MLSWAWLVTTLTLLLLLPLLNHQHRKNVFATVSESIGGDTIDVIVMDSNIQYQNSSFTFQYLERCWEENIFKQRI